MPAASPMAAIHMIKTHGGLHRLVVDDLGQRIAAGEVEPGQVIAPEEVGSRLGVSRTVVREALRDLQAKGMVLPRPKTGTRVLAVESWNLLDPQVIGWRVRTAARTDQLRELIELRSCIEPSALRGACEHSTPAQLDELDRQSLVMAESLTRSDLALFTEADVAFHNTVLLASGNKIYRQFMAPFAATFRALDDLHLLPDQLDDAVLDDAVVVRHRQLVKAIAAGDTEWAVRLNRELIGHSRWETGL